MSHSADAESSHTDANMIELITAQESVRRRTTMYIISTDYRGLHSLIQLTIEGLLWHYRFLKNVPSHVAVLLEEDGSAIISIAGETMPAEALQQSIKWLERELSTLMTGYPNSLFIVNALSRSLNVTIRMPENRWRSLLFEQGVLRRDEESTNPLDENYDIQFCIQPDFTILKPGTFDYQYILELTRSMPESDPIVPIAILDTRSHPV